MRAPAAWPIPPTRRSTCRCGASPTIDSLHLPQRCVLVGVELLDDATDLPSFRHPLNAAYVLGPERSGLSPAMLQRCHHVVRIPTRFALNLAVAGALVLYDRLLQHGRFAERPVGSTAVPALPQPSPAPWHAAVPPQHSRLGGAHVTRRSHDARGACSPARRAPYLCPMRLARPCLPARSPSPLPAAAQAQRTGRAASHAAPAGPKAIGKFDDWTAATHQEAGQTVCYAFTRAQDSAPGVARPRRGGADRHPAARRARRRRDQRRLRLCRQNAAVTVQVDTTGLDFYTAQRTAFARDGKAAVAALREGAQALARSPGPRDGQMVVDTFSLSGFSAAYAAINKACPAR